MRNGWPGWIGLRILVHPIDLAELLAKIGQGNQA
jgi:hypothetical protein